MRLRILLPVAAAALAACSPAADSDATDPSDVTDPSTATGPSAATDTNAATIPNAATVPGGNTGSSDATDPRALVAIISTAAEARDYETLSAHMADAFSYSFGRTPSSEGALARYREQPELLDKLVDVLGRDCAPKTVGAEHWFVCPAAAADETRSYYGWRAGFRQKDDHTWEFVWFIAGD